MGILYVVATPIGNLEDISIRAIKTLLTVPVIACEDTRRTGQLIKILQEKYKFLINLFDLKPKKYISVRDWNEANQVNNILWELNNNDVALVSDAGTPLLSDPGYKIVKGAHEAGYKVVPIPGAFAAAAAISAAGLPTDKLAFWGFWDKKAELIPLFTNIVYESPKRFNKTLEYIKSKYPSAKIIISRELTKIHEYVGPDDGNTFKGEALIMVYLSGS